MRKQFWNAAGMFLFLVTLCVAARLLAHWPNFTPLAAAALFAGSWYSRRTVAVCVPLIAMLLSDCLIGFYEPATMATVYLAMAFPVLLRPLLAGRWRIAKAAGCSVLCSAVFFVSTNVAVWMFGGAYPQNASGLAACLAAGVPFFKYMLYGNVAWTTALFTTHALVMAQAARPALGRPRLVPRPPLPGQKAPAVVRR